MAWPTAFAATAENGNSASVTALATPSTVALTAGDIILVVRKWEGTDTTVSASDGVNTYAQFTTDHGTTTEPFVSCCWALATTTASLTITSTLGAARTWNDLVVGVVRRDAAGTVSSDGTPIAAQGTSTAPNSGNMTTATQETNGSLQIGWYGEFGTNPTSELLFGSAADAIANGGISDNSELWTRRTTTGATGAASATLSFNSWACGVGSLKTVASAAGISVERPRGTTSPFPFLPGGEPNQR